MKKRQGMRRIGIRLALRHEGDFWNAYIAHEHTMKDARLIGSVLIGAARNPEIKHGFMELMQSVMAMGIEEVSGEAPEWNAPQAAPESERSGNA